MGLVLEVELEVVSRVDEELEAKAEEDDEGTEDDEVKEEGPG